MRNPFVRPSFYHWLASALLVVGNARAHDTDHPNLRFDPPEHDAPGPPLRDTGVFFPFLEHPDMDDGFLIFPSDAELSLSIGVAHARHGSRSVVVAEPDLDYDATGGFWIPFEEIYAHTECSPMDPIVITVSGFEADATKLDELENALLTIASKIAALLLTQTTNFEVDSGLLQDIVKGVLATLNPDDTLGSGSVVAPSPGTYYVTTAGGDYSVEATFEVSSDPLPGDACDPDSFFVPPPELCYFSSVYFDSLLEACNLIDQVEVEEGDPGHVTPQDLADAKSSLNSLAIGMAHWAAAHMVEDARGLSGFSSAYSHLQQGAANNTPLAILDFRQAFCAAELAIVNDVPDPSAPAMSPAAVAVPELIATRAGRSVDYLVGVFGDGSSGALVQSVTGGPPGATFVLEPADPEHPSWQVLHVTQNGPLGTYAVQVQFTDPQVSPLALTLDIDQAGTTDATVVAPAPERVALHVVRPNPVVLAGSVAVDLTTTSTLDLRIYDVAGRQVRDLARNKTRDAGRHFFAFDARSLPSGVYYLRMVVQSFDGDELVETQKFVVTR